MSSNTTLWPAQTTRSIPSLASSQEIFRPIAILSLSGRHDSWAERDLAATSEGMCNYSYLARTELRLGALTVTINQTMIYHLSRGFFESLRAPHSQTKSQELSPPLNVWIS